MVFKQQPIIGQLIKELTVTFNCAHAQSFKTGYGQLLIGVQRITWLPQHWLQKIPKDLVDVKKGSCWWYSKTGFLRFKITWPRPHCPRRSLSSRSCRGGGSGGCSGSAPPPSQTGCCPGPCPACWRMPPSRGTSRGRLAVAGSFRSVWSSF